MKESTILKTDLRQHQGSKQLGGTVQEQLTKSGVPDSAAASISSDGENALPLSFSSEPASSFSVCSIAFRAAVGIM